MTDITIPPEAVEAAARASAMDDGYDETWWDECVSRFGSDWALLERYRKRARSTIRAALAAWPGMTHVIEPDEGGPAFLHLPLPENSNDP